MGSRSTIEETLNEVPEMKKKKKKTKLKVICSTDKLVCVSLCLSYCNFLSKQRGSEVLLLTKLFKTGLPKVHGGEK